MGFLVVILMLALIALVAAVVSAPVRRARRSGVSDSADVAGVRLRTGEARQLAAEGLSREELEAAREAKYREIRDAELDYRTGKLSPEDYEAIDAGLRAEAIEILDRLEKLRPRDA
ncbi:MAG TPA: hypothetical protein VK790_09660 [Solirubrobacteraceae bacterium]|nr:hypothetical protein [Solirubrobacteraceae bacterium]